MEKTVYNTYLFRNVCNLLKQTNYEISVVNVVLQVWKHLHECCS